MKKRNLLLAAVLTLLIPISVCAEPLGDVYFDKTPDINYIDNDSSEPSMLTEEELPSRFDMRDMSWYGKYIKIKDQGEYGLCWACATATAAEISYCKETGGKQVLETSPGHFGYFFYHYTGDEMGGTTGDSISPVNKEWYDAGGSNVYTFQALANQIGLALEKDAPYSRILEGYDASLKNSRYLTLENADYIDFDGDSTYILKLKNLVYEKGAAVVAYNPKQGTVNKEKYAYYNDSVKKLSHAAVIIGWDDSFAKENFSTEPSQDGAWIVQNSWGDKSSYDRGCIYVSYDDLALSNGDAIAVDMCEYDEKVKCYQHDGTVGNTGMTFTGGGRVAEMFEVQDYCTLEQVGFTEWNEGEMTYSIDVYVNPKGSNLESGTKAASLKNVKTQHTGYHTFDLGKKIKLRPGERYAVVLTLGDGAKLGIEKSLNYSSVTIAASLMPGKSLVYSGGSWIDQYSNSFGFRIKSYSRDIEPEPIDNMEISLSKDTYTYSGEENRPKVSIEGLEEGLDYTVSYSDNIDAGTAKATIHAFGFYKGERTLTFTIKKAMPKYENPDGYEVTCMDTIGSIDIPEGFSWEADEETVLQDGEYQEFMTYTPQDVKNYEIVEHIPVSIISRHQFTQWETVIEPTYREKGTKEKYCEKCGFEMTEDIPMLSLNSPTVSSLMNMSDGVKVKWNKVTGAEGYVVSYRIYDGSWKKNVVKGNQALLSTLKNGKTYQIKVRAVAGDNDSEYSKVKSIARVNRMSISKAYSVKKGIKVTWSKKSAYSGYEITYRKAGSKKWKTVKSTGSYKVIDNLKKGKKYTVKIRAYVIKNGNKYYGPYSKTKQAKYKG